MRPRAGYTLVEVLVALAILSILIAPCAWVLVEGARATGEARRLDDALQLGREAWGLVRLRAPDSVRDSQWTETAGGRSYRVVLDALDDSGAAGLAGVVVAGDTLAAIPVAKGPAEFSVCVLGPLSPRALPEAPADTARCWRWLRPRTRILP